METTSKFQSANEAQRINWSNLTTTDDANKQLVNQLFDNLAFELTGSNDATLLDIVNALQTKCAIIATVEWLCNTHLWSPFVRTLSYKPAKADKSKLCQNLHDLTTCYKHAMSIDRTQSLAFACTVAMYRLMLDIHSFFDNHDKSLLKNMMLDSVKEAAMKFDQVDIDEDSKHLRMQLIADMFKDTQNFQHS